MSVEPKKSKGIERLSVFYAGTVGPEAKGGHGGFGIVIYDDDAIVYQEAGYVPPAATLTAFSVEYMAIAIAIDRLFREMKQNHHVRFYGHSLPVVNQINEIWDVDPELAGLYTEVRNKARKFRDLKFTWIAKSKNVVAVALSKVELKKRNIEPAGPRPRIST